MNSVSLNVDGYKVVEFKDGSSIKYTPTQDTFSNTLWGTLTHQLAGTCEFEDTTNGLKGTYEIMNNQKRGVPKDYVQGKITKNGQVVSEMSGNYMGYLEFDKVRYFDLREVTACQISASEGSKVR